MLSFHSLSIAILASAVLFAAPSNAAPIVAGPTISYDFDYDGAGANLTAYGIGSLTVSYTDEGGQTIGAPITAFDLSLTFTPQNNSSMSSTFLYGLGDLSSDAVVGSGSAANTSLEYFVLTSTDEPAQFTLSFGQNVGGSTTYPEPYATAGTVSLVPEPSASGFRVAMGLVLVIMGLARRRTRKSMPAGDGSVELLLPVLALLAFPRLARSVRDTSTTGTHKAEPPSALLEV